MSACGRAVVKLGGGLITFKDKPLTVDWKSLLSAAEQLSLYVRRGGTLLAVVHGGGSFGHYIASKVMAGGIGPMEASLVQEAMDYLSLLVSSALRSYGLPASVHHPRSFCVGPHRCNFDVIERDIESGLVPVTHGDALPSREAASIVSGDWLAAEIAIRLGADCLVYAARSGGIYGRSGSLLSTLSSTDEIGPAPAAGADVTGGIKAKVKEALRASRGGVRRVLIVGGPDIAPALLGEDRGTRVVAFD